MIPATNQTEATAGRGRQPLLGLTRSQLIAEMTALGQPRHRGDQLARWIYQRRVDDIDRMTNLPGQLRRELAARYTLRFDPPVAHQESPDGTEKLLFRDAGGDRGAVWEAVLMRDRDRRTVCVSTQAGCALGCSFCATAKLGLLRNLTPGEIIAQVIAARRLLTSSETLTNVVFMGMGEPLHNFESVKAALEIIGADWGLEISHNRTTVSTVGLVPQIHQWAEEKIKAKLAISLTAANDALRSELMPINRRYPLAELKQAAIHVAKATRRRVTFEYILLDGINDSLAHARQLVSFIHGVPCKINLIRFHPNDGSPYRRTTEERVAAFRDYLYPRCPAVNIRKSFGVDIDAACGQLAGRSQGG
jgi:23S rRNA (adenine2503-C2)-methyltransferase